MITKIGRLKSLWVFPIRDARTKQDQPLINIGGTEREITYCVADFVYMIRVRCIMYVAHIVYAHVVHVHGRYVYFFAHYR